MPDELKRAASLSFEGGLLTVNLQGYDQRNGDGRISFKDDDLDWGHGEDHGWRFMSLPKSELEAIRDWLNQHLPASPKHYTWIGDDHPPNWRCVGSIDVADPADTATARDRCLRIGGIYDGRTESVAEPCAADLYDEVVTVEDANALASAVERMADNPRGGEPAARAYIMCARLIRTKLGSVRS